MKIDRQELKDLIPHGYGKKIAQKAGVSENSVSNFLNNPKVKSLRIEMAALEIAVEIKKKRDQLLYQIKN